MTPWIFNQEGHSAHEAAAGAAARRALLEAETVATSSSSDRLVVEVLRPVSAMPNASIHPLFLLNLRKQLAIAALPDPANLMPTLSVMAASPAFTIQAFLDEFGDEDQE